MVGFLLNGILYENLFQVRHWWLILCYKGQDSFAFFVFCWKASFLSSNFTSESVFCIKRSGPVTSLTEYILLTKIVLTIDYKTLANESFHKIVLLPL